MLLIRIAYIFSLVARCHRRQSINSIDTGTPHVNEKEYNNVGLLYRLGVELSTFRLIDMQDGGAEGVMVPVTGDESYTLPGFTGSAVSSLEIIINDYAALKTIVLNDYDESLVDIVDIKMG